MKSMFKLMLILALVFASTFLVLNLTGLLSIERIKIWLDMAQSVSPWVISLLVATLLFVDLFVAMPTLTIMLLAGFFLGPMVGAFSAIGGLSLAGFCGYFMSDRYGDKVLRKIVRDDKDRADAMESFQRHGTTTILLSRAVPILPEVSACMAGLTKMRLGRFVVAWLASTIPYAIIATYAGSISSISNPQPAIYTAIGLTVTLWLAWFIFRRYSTKICFADFLKVP